MVLVLWGKRPNWPEMIEQSSIKNQFVTQRPYSFFKGQAFSPFCRNWTICSVINTQLSASGGDHHQLCSCVCICESFLIVENAETLFASAGDYLQLFQHTLDCWLLLSKCNNTRYHSSEVSFFNIHLIVALKMRKYSLPEVEMGVIIANFYTKCKYSLAEVEAEVEVIIGNF